MSIRSTLALLLLWLAPLLLIAAPGAGPPDYSSSRNNAQTLPATTTATTNSSAPNSLYALQSQPAIAQLAQILGADGVGGLPPLTTSSLLADLISQHGLDTAADQAFVSILPSGSKATRLDTNVTYYSTQLATLLGQLLESLSSDFWNGYFLLLAQHGQMMAYTGESLSRLEASLAGTPVETVEAVEEDP
ncbi:MAG: hypothetical protein Q9161_004709 [Pseudevernia consocians]